MKKKIQAIEQEIDAIKQRLLGIGEMRPGSMSKQKRSKGTLYHQLSYTHAGKGHTEYVRSEMVSDVRKQLEAYQDYRQLNRRWVALAIELCRLKTELAKQGNKK